MHWQIVKSRWNATAFHRGLHFTHCVKKNRYLEKEWMS